MFMCFYVFIVVIIILIHHFAFVYLKFLFIVYVAYENTIKK